jgi:GNAT superfamily N-acetyltransferase
MQEVKIFTTAQLRQWLEHNQVAEGLTKEVIRPAMAWAIIHHPHVKDDDPIVAAIYDDGVLAASTCAYPEVLVHPQHKRVWWFPMLWVKPEYRGKAYGLVAIGSLVEIYGEDCAWTIWAVPEVIEMFERFGCNTYYFPRYFLNYRAIDTSSIKGKLASLKQDFQKQWRSCRLPKLPMFDYELRYMTNVDDESYEFISQHRDNRFLQSSQEVLNWDIHYPWKISMPLEERVQIDGAFFADVAADVQHHFVQVRADEKLIGVYRLRHSDNRLTCDTLFYTKEQEELVYASVVEHIRKWNVHHFDTEDGALAQYVRRYVYFPKYKETPISLSMSLRLQDKNQIIR